MISIPDEVWTDWNLLSALLQGESGRSHIWSRLRH
jgi:hypothetical protein